jgi:Tol biopolymer transport system component
MPDQGGEPVQVTRNGGFNAFESPDGRYLYYGRSEQGRSFVYRMPVEGGTDERLFESLINWASLAMGSRHMFFVRGQTPEGSGYGTEIHSYELASGQIRKVAETGMPIATLSPSPDERHLTYAAVELLGSDLMLVNDVR